jgi:hypothetical protein
MFTTLSSPMYSSGGQIKYDENFDPKNPTQKVYGTAYSYPEKWTPIPPENISISFDKNTKAK